MTLSVTVVALDDGDGVRLTLLLGASLGDVTELVAVAALRDSAVDDLTGILETLKVLLGCLGPDLTLTRTRSGRAESVGDSVLLVHVALKVHVGHGRSDVRLLNGNEPDSNVLAAESLLELDIGGVGSGLDVNLDGLLDVIELALLDSSDDALPGIVR